MNERQEAVTPVGEAVAVAGLDSGRAQRRVEQVVHGRAEFGLDRVRAAGRALDVERDDGPLVSRGPTEDRGLMEQAVPGDLAARQRRGGERFQLRGDRGQTELLGDWDEDVQGLPGSVKLFRLRQIPDRLHVVQGRVVARQGQKSPYMAITCDYSG
jgi:hypothetical protein